MHVAPQILIVTYNIGFSGFRRYGWKYLISDLLIRHKGVEMVCLDLKTPLKCKFDYVALPARWDESVLASPRRNVSKLRLEC